MCVWIHSVRWEGASVCQPLKLASGIRRVLKGFQSLGMIFWTSVSSHLSTQGLWSFWEGFHFPRGHGTSGLHVVATDGTVGKCQMGNQHVSLSPLLPHKPLAQASPCRQQRLRCLAVCLLSVWSPLWHCCFCILPWGLGEVAGNRDPWRCTIQGLWPSVLFTSLFSFMWYLRQF